MQVWLTRYGCIDNPQLHGFAALPVINIECTGHVQTLAVAGLEQGFAQRCSGSAEGDGLEVGTVA